MMNKINKKQWMKILFTIHCLLFTGMMLTSCVDTNVLPADKTIEEDFWKTKADVELMVVGTYKKMVTADVLNRLMVWGEMRSDEVIVNETPTGTIPSALQEVMAADIQTTNTFTDWASLYSVINYCNIVLSHAEQVLQIDPSYTDGDYMIDRSQMLALRALCYFYLVRAYRDVPFCTEGFTASSQELEVPQQSPLTILSACIDDLKEVQADGLQPDGFNDWRRVGYFTQDGIRALLADMYLWRGSMTHSTDDYIRAVECCQQVIASKQEKYPKDPLDPEASNYPLVAGDKAYGTVFVQGNSQEAILELQLDGSNNSNNTVCQFYYLYAKNASHGYLYASPMFSSTGQTQVYHTDKDYRYWQNTYDVGNTQLTNFDVRKMVSQQTSSVNPIASPSAYKRADEQRTFGDYNQNWIVYRLSDVMLMEAEARIAIATGNDELQLRQAFELIKEVNNRSLALKGDSLKYANYASQESMEALVLEERQRELCFEGKRWFDLLRYNYRHITPADPSRTMAEISAAGEDFPHNDDTMLSLMARKYEAMGNGAGVIAKMRTEPTLYWPISTSELKVNKNLKQNPAYGAGNLYQKNY